MEVSTLLQLASRLYQLAGLPVSLGSNPPSPTRIIFAIVCFCSYAIFSIVNLYILLTTESLNGYEQFLKLFWTLYPPVCAIVTTAMAFQYKSFTRMSTGVEYVGELIRVRKVAGTSAICQVSGFCLTSLTLSSIVLSLLTNAHEFANIYKNFDSFDGEVITVSMVFLLQIPSTVLFYAVLYHACLQYLVELRVIEELWREVSASASVLLPVAEDGTALNLSRCRELLEIYFEAKKVRLETESWLHVPLCMIMFTSAWYFPILAGEYRGPGQGIYRCVLTAYMIVGTVMKLGPLCINQLVDYRKSILLGQVSRKVINTEDPKLKNKLLNLFACIRDKYPNSPDVLVDFDFSLLTLLVDTVVLVITTFF